jgi:hypothetical protein
MAHIVHCGAQGCARSSALIQSARQPEMPLFYFHINEDSNVLYDEEGSDHPDLQAACGEAIEGIRQIISDAVLTGSPLRLEREMQVDDDAGHTLLRIMFREVVDFIEGQTGS